MEYDRKLKEYSKLVSVYDNLHSACAYLMKISKYINFTLKVEVNGKVYEINNHNVKRYRDFFVNKALEYLHSYFAVLREKNNIERLKEKTMVYES